MHDMKRCAYLVMDDPGDYVTDYHLGIPAMTDLGWQVDCVPWRDPATDWDSYDAVYICTPWDYADHLQQFMRVLEAIDASKAQLVNPLPLVRWNLTKSYLRDLEQRGGAIVPSIWFDAVSAAMVPRWFEQLGADRVVVKPQVGANAQHACVLTQPVADEVVAELLSVYRERPLFVQPFIDSIQTEGEYSLFFFGGEYSHAIRKVPAAGDFRSQEEHGAEILSIKASPPQIEAAERILSLVDPRPTYVRADFVREGDDDLLMELEMIEPSLYLRTDHDSPGRFARAFDRNVACD